MAREYDFTCKIAMIGNLFCGKSSLVRRMVKESFVEDDSEDPVEQVTSFYVTVCGKKVKANVWDTCGQERFNDVTSTYLRGSLAVMLCFDTASGEGFEDTPHWLRTVQRYTNKCPVILVGCKADLPTKVENTVAESFAQTNQLLGYAPTSAKTGDGVQQAFMIALEHAVKELSSLASPHDKTGKDKDKKGKDHEGKKKPKDKKNGGCGIL
eukprot:TRINITY_DN4507_c0_g1_i1.p1 TRINITY_DN4507_c0_g1~~TRINITY_DN4507_c0_g1_i1.p1  ORF type:complete len:222 (-),score=52.02 TRINITY_DN4507_c0_g1_i1:140-769(-)